MYGTFVPITTGHMPIDFYQKKNYTLFNNKKIRKTATFAPRWKLSKLCGPGGIRTRGLFSAIEEQLGEKGENAVHYV